MKEKFYRLYSPNVQRLASFYVDVFCGSDPELIDYHVGIISYQCNLPDDNRLLISESRITGIPKNIVLEVCNINLVHRKLSTYGVAVKREKGTFKQIVTKDLDGNTLIIIQRKMLCFMPIVEEFPLR